MGGDCLNYGCVPSKALLAASRAKMNFKQAYAHVQASIVAIAPHESVKRFQKLGVKVILEQGAFIDEHTLKTKNHIIKAKRFIIAAGNRPFIPDIPGLSMVNYLTNETLFALKEQPKHLLIIGGGPIGIEMADAFHELGSQVTVIQSSKILPKDDPEAVELLKNRLIEKGIVILENAKVLQVQQSQKGIECTYTDAAGQTKQLFGSHLLIATGRRHNTETLNLGAANVNVSAKGIEVDDCLKTTNPRIYAIGDCVGGYQFTHVAAYHAGLAIRNSIFRWRAKVHTAAIPWVTYTDPELAHVGFTQSQLEARKIKHRVLQMPFSENDRAVIERHEEGMIKVLVSLNGTILGTTILGPHAGELICLWVMAIQNKLKIGAIANTIMPYPTLGDINKRIANSYYVEKIFSPWMKLVVRFMMWLNR